MHLSLGQLDAAHEGAAADAHPAGLYLEAGPDEVEGEERIAVQRWQLGDGAVDFGEVWREIPDEVVGAVALVGVCEG